MTDVESSATAASSPNARPRATPRPYEFPAVDAPRLANGLTILIADLPGRPLVSASLRPAERCRRRARRRWPARPSWRPAP